MRYAIFVLKALFTLYGFILFIVIMLLLFPFVVFASFFGKVKGGNLIYRICQFWADIIFVCWGIFHKNYFEMPHDTGKPYVFVFNHVSYIDIPIILKAVRKQHFRVLGKAEMAKVPVFGFFYRNAAVMVDRADPQKRMASVLQLKSIIRRNISVVIAPEGTFNMSHAPLKSFFDGAFRVAIETQTPIKPILFLDGYDRLSYKNILSLTPGRSRAVYLEEISVDGLTIRDVKSLKEKVYKLMEEKLLFYKGSWIELGPN
jgi:1-acyl-sn-glycerol-3-phosphate acyltransferase